MSVSTLLSWLSSQFYNYLTDTWLAKSHTPIDPLSHTYMPSFEYSSPRFPHHLFTSNTTDPECAYPFEILESGTVITIASAFIFTTFLWHTLFMITLLVRHCVALRNEQRLDTSQGALEPSLSVATVHHQSARTPLRSLTHAHHTPTGASAYHHPHTHHASLFSRITSVFRLPKLSSMNTKTLFYISLVFFSTCRFIYFLLEIIRLVDHDEEVISKHINWVALGLYHMASTWFYTAFMILALNWAQEYLNAAQISQDLASKKFYKPKLLLVVFNVFIHSTELVILAVFIAFSIFEVTFGSNIVNVIQLMYHSVLCFCVVVLFVLWIFFAKKQRLHGIEFESSYGYRVLLYTALIVCFIIILKGLVNLVYGILRAVALVKFIEYDGNVCASTDVMVVSVGALLLDLIPVAIVVFVWKSPSVEDPDESQSEAGRIIVTSPLGSYDDLHRMNAAQPIAARRRNFSDDGEFFYGSV